MNVRFRNISNVILCFKNELLYNIGALATTNFNFSIHFKTTVD